MTSAILPPKRIGNPVILIVAAFFRGLGACVALPAFESLLPGVLRRRKPRPARRWHRLPPARRCARPSSYFPNGAIPSTWWPKGEGTDFEFNRTMKPLEI